MSYTNHCGNRCYDFNMRKNSMFYNSYTLFNSIVKVKYMKAFSMILVISLFSSLILTGCDESDDESKSEIVEKYETLCEIPVDSMNCPDDVDLTLLVVVCKQLASALINSAECNEKLDDYVACNAQRTWACAEGGEIPLPVAPDPCSDEILAPFTLPNGSCMDQSQVSSFK